MPCLGELEFDRLMAGDELAEGERAVEKKMRRAWEEGVVLCGSRCSKVLGVGTVPACLEVHEPVEPEGRRLGHRVRQDVPAQEGSLEGSAVLRVPSVDDRPFRPDPRPWRSGTQAGRPPLAGRAARAGQGPVTVVIAALALPDRLAGLGAGPARHVRDGPLARTWVWK